MLGIVRNIEMISQYEMPRDTCCCVPGMKVKTKLKSEIALLVSMTTTGAFSWQLDSSSDRHGERDVETDRECFLAQNIFD